MTQVTAKSMAKDYLAKIKRPGQGPCLVPNPEAISRSSSLITCHENDFCECEVLSAFEAGHEAGGRTRQKVILEHLRKAPQMNNVRPTFLQELADWIERTLPE